MSESCITPGISSVKDYNLISTIQHDISFFSCCLAITCRKTFTQRSDFFKAAIVTHPDGNGGFSHHIHKSIHCAVALTVCLKCMVFYFHIYFYICHPFRFIFLLCCYIRFCIFCRFRYIICCFFRSSTLTSGYQQKNDTHKKQDERYDVFQFIHLSFLSTCTGMSFFRFLNLYNSICMIDISDNFSNFRYGNISG